MTVPTDLQEAHDDAAEAAFGSGDPVTRYDRVVDLISWHRNQGEALQARLHTPQPDPEPEPNDEG